MKPVFMTYTKKDLINLAVCMVLSVLIFIIFAFKDRVNYQGKLENTKILPVALLFVGFFSYFILDWLFPIYFTLILFLLVVLVLVALYVFALFKISSTFTFFFPKENNLMYETFNSLGNLSDRSARFMLF